MNIDVSEGEEAYLKRALEAFEDDPSGIIKTSDLADRLNVSSASVTEMIKKPAVRRSCTSRRTGSSGSWTRPRKRS